MALEGKSVLVTGTSRGLGLAIVSALAERRARVLCHARTEADARRVAAEVGGVPIWGDLADDSGIAAIAEQAAAAAPILHVLVNNAGVLRRTTLADVSRDDFEFTMAVNLYAPVLLTQALLGPLRAASSARIVVVSSTEGQFAIGMRGGHLAYRASKAAVNAAVVNMAAELAPDGILVNTMHPGWVVTDMGGPGSSVPAEEAAEHVVYLCDLPGNGPTAHFFWESRQIPW
jgi:NAD(P)-dependent dehydrogenase (short-subunit alcohol dehydrogenase family)